MPVVGHRVARGPRRGRPRHWWSAAWPDTRVCQRPPSGRRSPASCGRGRQRQAAAASDVAGPTPDVFHGEVVPDSVGSVDLPGRRLGRPDRHLAARRHRQDRRRPGRDELANDLRGRRAAAASAPPPALPRELREPAAATPRRRCATPRRPARPALAPALSRRGRRAAGAYPLRELVTRGAAVRRAGWTARGPCSAPGTSSSRAPTAAGTPNGDPVARHLRAPPPSALPRDRRDGLRRGLPAADPPDRQGAPQGPATTPLTAGPDDVGSPWAIGCAEGGHDAIHPDLGTIDDFDAFVAARPRASAWRSPSTSRCSARPTTRGSPAHPEWFTVRPTARSPTRRTRRRSTRTSTRSTSTTTPTGSTHEVLRVVRLWIDHGVQIFRVDNPHTKPPNFWDVADRRGQGRPTPTCCSWPRRSPGRPGCTAWPSSASRSPTRTSPGATPSGSSTEFGRADRRARGLRAAEPLRQHPGHPARVPAVRRPAACSRSAPCWPPRCRPTWGVYSGYELFEHRPVRAGQRGVPGLREVPAAPARLRGGAGNEGDSLEPYLTRLNEIRRAAPGAAPAAHHPLPPRRQRRAARLQQVRPGHRRRRARGRHAQPVRPRGGHAVAGHGRAGHGSPTTGSGCATRSPARNTMGSGELRPARPAKAVHTSLNMPLIPPEHRAEPATRE